MNVDWKQIRQWVIIIASGIILYWGLEHLEVIGGLIGNVVGVLSPFLIGGAVAFILRRPLARIEGLLLKLSECKKLSFLKKVSRILGIILTFLLFVAVMILVVFLVVPEFIHALAILVQSVEQFVGQLQSNPQEWGFISEQLVEWINSLQLDWAQIGNDLKDWVISGAGTVLGGTVNVVSSVVSGVTTTVMALIFCIYLLLQKETLARQSKKLIYAVLPEKKATSLLEILTMTGDTFSNFFTGQITEAAILGTMFFVVMTLLGFPYALVISVLIGVMALIPIFGAFIGCAVGVFLILMVNPLQALWFVVLFLVLQQIEGNLIYPRVVGSSVGLPSIWVLVAVSVGGSVMGVLGMILFIPGLSVVYKLLARWTNRRLVQKKEETRWAQPPRSSMQNARSKEAQLTNNASPKKRENK
ncbi:MAG: AI-2E family transporter [Lachnospiraceae bacterium]|nr:AI-2E family transporter [Lachnospiraceae bacterium]